MGRNKILDARGGGIDKQFPPKYIPLGFTKWPSICIFINIGPSFININFGLLNQDRGFMTMGPGFMGPENQDPVLSVQIASYEITRFGRPWQDVQSR